MSKAAEKSLQPAEKVAKSLLALREDLVARDMRTGKMSEELLKINSCLYSEYPHRRLEEKSKKLRTFTVFGVYEDTQQRYVDHIEACSWQHAEELARETAGADVLIAGTVEGELVASDNLMYGFE